MTTEDPILKRLIAEGKTAPRITMEHIESVIVAENYFTAEQGAYGHAADKAVADNKSTFGYHSPPSLSLLTFCVLTLANGYTVTGQSACASPENFDAEAGRKYARADAIKHVWPLEGYLLKQRLYNHELDTLGKFNTVEEIARVAHEVNRGYCEALGDTSQVDWDDAPDWQKQSAMTGVQLHLDNPDASAAASHESWMAEKLADGWAYGSFKDPANKLHPCIVPFNQLPVEQQAKDFIFRAVVHALSPQDQSVWPASAGLILEGMMGKVKAKELKVVTTIFVEMSYVRCPACDEANDGWHAQPNPDTIQECEWCHEKYKVAVNPEMKFG